MGRCKDVFGSNNRDSQNTAVAAVAFVQVALMLVINIWGFCRMRQAKKRLAISGYEEPRENTFLLPIYTRLMWATCFALLLDALIHYVTPFSIIYSNSLTASFLNGIAYLVKQFCFEVVAFFLMSPSAGRRSLIKAIIFAGIWAIITFGLKVAYTYNVDINPRYSASFDLLWLSMLLAFYYLVWLFPGMHILFRRPAVRFYSAFWAIIYSLFMLSTVLRYFHVDGGYCLYIANSALLLGLCPWAVYKVCNDDSLYWQGGTKLSNDETKIAAVVQDNTVGQAVAANVAMAEDSNVNVINFVSLTINMDSNDLSGDSDNGDGVVGQGTYARVYQGLYRGAKVAIKLIYAPELTQEIVYNLMKEAATLQSLRHRHVVKVEGVCIMPPALALVMELCKTSLFSYLHPERETELALERERLARSELEVIVDGTAKKQTEKAKIASLQSRIPITASTLGQQPVAAESDSDDEADEEVPLPPLLEPLPLIEQVRLMLECAKAICFLHDRAAPVVHLDIKSGNFLLAADEKLTVRLADFELATRAVMHKSALSSTANLNNGSNPTNGRPATASTHHANSDDNEAAKQSAGNEAEPKLNYSCADCATCQEGGALATCFAKCVDCVTKALSRDKDLLGKSEIIVPEAPNWLAPELMQNPDVAESISPACDIYSLGCVFWEIATRRVPFEELAVHFHDYNAAITKAKKDYHNRRAREAAAARAANANAHAASQPRRSISTYPSRAAAEAAAAVAASSHPADIQLDTIGSGSFQVTQGERPMTPTPDLPMPQVQMRGLGAYPSRAVPPWTKRRGTVNGNDRPQSASQLKSTGSFRQPKLVLSESNEDSKQDDQAASATSSVVVSVPGTASSTTLPTATESIPSADSSAAATIELNVPPPTEGVACYDDTDTPLHMEDPLDVQTTMYDWIKNQGYRPPVPRDIPLELRWCISASWAPLPHQRPSAKKLVQVLSALYARLQQERGQGLTTSGSIVSSNLHLGGILERKESVAPPTIPNESNLSTLQEDLSSLANADPTGEAAPLTMTRSGSSSSIPPALSSSQLGKPVACPPSILSATIDVSPESGDAFEQPPADPPLRTSISTATTPVPVTTTSTTTVTTTMGTSAQSTTTTATTTVVRPTPPTSPRPPDAPLPRQP